MWVSHGNRFFLSIYWSSDSACSCAEGLCDVGCWKEEEEDEEEEEEEQQQQQHPRNDPKSIHHEPLKHAHHFLILIDIFGVSEDP